MSEKEMEEGRRAGIPNYILGMMVMGLEIGEPMKDVVKRHGKVYVLGHSKERGQTLVKPQLRDLPGYRKIPISKRKEHTVKEHLDGIKKYDVERAISIAKIGEIRGVLREIHQAGFEQSQVALHFEPLTKEEEGELQRFSTYMDDSYKEIIENLEKSSKCKFVKLY